MNKIVLYFPYALKEAKSGSSVRPQKILEAFRVYSKRNNYELIEIYGNSRERKKKIIALKKNINPKEIILCYMENSTLPIWLTDEDHLPRTPFLEFNLFRYFNKHNIPLGVFYRDAYWLFDDEYPLKGLKKTIMKIIYRLEKTIYSKFSSRVFLPSIEMNKYLRFPTEKISALPPGSEMRFFTKMSEERDYLNIIYVGAISKKMGLYNMMNAVKKANKSGVNCKLLIICRVEDKRLYRRDLEVFEKQNLIEVRSAFGNELYKYYEGADLAIIPREKNTYNDFSVPVKLFEYLSFGLPVISTNNDAVANILSKGPYGVIVNSNSEDIAKGIIQLSDEKLRETIRDKIVDEIPSKHLWVNRIEQIINVLCGKMEINK